MIPQLRLAVRLLLLVAAVAVAVPPHLLWRLARRRSPWPRLFLGACGWIVGARRRSQGVPLAAPAVFVANHLSWIDILVLAGRTGTTFVAYAELRDVPLIGWLCVQNNTLFVRRDDRLGVAGQIGTVRDALADDWAVTLFPEGSTGDGRTLLPFKSTLLAVLEPPPPGVRVQPVRIDYGAATGELAWVGDEPGASHAARVLQRRGSFEIHLRFLEPFDPAALGGRKAIAAEARARIEAAVSAPPA